MKSAFQQEVFFNLDQDVGGDGTNFKVPAGKRFVIEQVSGAAELPVGQQHLHWNLTTTVNGLKAVYYFSPANFPANLGTFQFNQHVRIYADPGTDVELFAVRQQVDNIAEVIMSLSGYLVDFP